MDMKYFISNRVFDVDLTDVVIEIRILKNTPEVDCIPNDCKCVLVTYCKILPSVVDGINSYRIRPDYQKIRIKGIWFDMNEIYGFSADTSNLQ